jgi:hypothetical protein
MITINKDLETPDNISADAKKAIEIILTVLEKHDSLDTGGCKAFYSPQEWTERGEEYGTESELVICHDGGGLAPFCNYDYQCYSLIDEMTEALNEVGMYIENCTGWYSALYRG